MKIVAIDNVLFAEDAFSTMGDVELVSDRNISNKILKDADILVARSTIKFNRTLLEGTGVKFAGTATIGTDHIDIDYLNQQGISWCAAPGCNANSVAEYIVSALLYLASRHNISLKGKTIGIVGVGNVGSRVVQKALALGMNLLLNDPPRAESEGSDGFVSLEQLLAESDIVTMHVPLIKTGKHPTLQMVNEKFFELMKHGSI
ncbi:MAG: 4-phosphoerythronate dehydrogenase, partial [Lentisphaerae bacterium]|nr:4-phosphoerythronate dehydrogenase [Lentisphaerota bacterium]